MKKINVVITFDDGFKSWVTTTLPILTDLNLSATFFISSGSINLTQKDEIDFTNKNLNKTYGTGCLTFEDIKKIATENITIGGHTINHAHLSQLNDKEQILHEIIEDKKQLEEISNKKIDYFSYPFGEYHNRYFDLQEILKDAGYKGAVTLMPGINNQKTNPFLLFRMITGAKLDLNVFKAITYENSSAVYFLKKLFSMNRDRGRPQGRRPPTPPDIRARIRRFESN